MHIPLRGLQKTLLGRIIGDEVITCRKEASGPTRETGCGSNKGGALGDTYIERAVLYEYVRTEALFIADPT
jgi:hypothetical protein